MSEGRVRLIRIVPLTPIERRLLVKLCEGLNAVFGVECRINGTVNMIEKMRLGYLELLRYQYNSDRILRFLSDEVRVREGEKVLGIADLDAYVPGLNFVFGEAMLSGGYAVIYLRRLKSIRWGKYFERALKEAVHELGHTMGLTHCPRRSCVMSFSNSLRDVDNKSFRFCQRCAEKLRATAGLELPETGILK